MYGKLFDQTFTGSMMGKGTAVFAVWAYCIANASRTGRVELNPKLISTLLGASEKEIIRVLEYLTAPDPDSRTKEHDGRRLLRVGQYDYDIPNYPKYRAIRNEEERREYNRQKMAESRARKRDEPSKGNGQGNPADDGFENFYQTYPRHVGRAKAEAAWHKLKPDQALRLTISAAIEQQRTNWREPKFIPHPATWLNGRRWEDEPPQQAAVNVVNERCYYCEQAAVRITNEIPHCARPDHLDEASARRR